MKRYLKKFLTLILTAGLVLGCVSVEGLAAEESKVVDTAETTEKIIQQEDIENPGMTENDGEEAVQVLSISTNQDETVTELEPLPDDPQYELLMHEDAIEEDNGIAVLNLQSTGEIKAQGIDVSYYQGDIDWEKVKEAGVDFAFIRVGYRGGSEGELHTDTKAEQNLQGAIDAGIKVGAYFFSTALTEAEAKEEAKYTVKILKSYNIDYPVAYDCEGYFTEGYRDYGLSSTQRSKNAQTFLDYVQSCGYAGILYDNKSNLSGGEWDLDTLASRYAIWVAQYPYYKAEDKTCYTSFSKAIDKSISTSYNGDYRFWQFTSSGKVDGISGNVDLDFEYKTTGSLSSTVSNLATPTLKSATSSGGKVTVKWNEVGAAAGYRVFRKTSGGSWKNIGMTTSTSYKDSDVNVGTTYYYTVRAYTGSESKAKKNTYDSKYWSGYDKTGVSVKVVLDTPTLKSAKSSNGEIKVKWNSVSGASGYRVFRKEEGGKWKKIAMTTSTSYTDTGRSVGKTYYYTVRAYRGSQSTAKKNTYSSIYWSGYDKTGVSAVGSSVLSTPELKSASSSASGIKVKWNAVNDAKGYRVFRKEKGGKWKKITTTTSKSYTDTDVMPGTTYYYTVRAYKGSLSTARQHKYKGNYWSDYDKAGVSATAK